MPSQAGGLLAEALIKGATKGLFNLGRKGASEAVKSDYAKQKIKGIANKYLDQALDRFTSDLSKKLDPFSGGAINNKAYCGTKKVPKGKYQGSAVDCKKQNQIRYWGINQVNKKLLKSFEKDEKKKQEFKRKERNLKQKIKQLEKKSNTTKKKTGGSIDIHNAILKIAPKKGFVMPGHNYTGPGNPLEKQLKHDPNTGQILEIYQQPTGKTDAVSMQHDVDYTVCGNKPKSDQVKCKNKADRKMVKALDAIPWKERQWGHTIARNAIAAKSKLGMGVKKSKNGKSRRVKKIGK